jgi:hypothetical protein
LRRRGDSGLFRDLREAGGILHGHVCKDFTVESDAGDFHAVDELTVCEASQAGGRTDTLNPQATILTLFDAAIAKSIAISAIGGFLSGLIKLALREEKAFCPLKILLTPGSAFSAAFYAWHGFSPSIFWKQLKLRENARIQSAFGATGLFPVRFVVGREAQAAY